MKFIEYIALYNVVCKYIVQIYNYVIIIIYIIIW